MPIFHDRRVGQALIDHLLLGCRIAGQSPAAEGALFDQMYGKPPLLQTLTDRGHCIFLRVLQIL